MSETIKNAANYVGDKVGELSGQTQKEAGKQQVKSDETSIGQKLDGAKDYISGATDEQKNKASAEANKQKVTH